VKWPDFGVEITKEGWVIRPGGHSACLAFLAMESDQIDIPWVYFLQHAPNLPTLWTSVLPALVPQYLTAGVIGRSIRSLPETTLLMIPSLWTSGIWNTTKEIDRVAYAAGQAVQGSYVSVLRKILELAPFNVLNMVLPGSTGGRTKTFLEQAVKYGCNSCLAVFKDEYQNNKRRGRRMWLSPGLTLRKLKSSPLYWTLRTLQEAWAMRNQVSKPFGRITLASSSLTATELKDYVHVLKKLDKMTGLSLANNDLDFCDENATDLRETLGPIMAGQPLLRNLNLDQARLCDSGFEVLSSLLSNRSLPILSLRHAQLTAKSIEIMVKAPYAATIEELILSGNNIGWEGLEKLAELGPKLRILRLTNTGLKGHPQKSVLEKIRGAFKTMNILDVNENDIDDDGFSAFRRGDDAASGAKGLVELDVSHSSVTGSYLFGREGQQSPVLGNDTHNLIAAYMGMNDEGAAELAARMDEGKFHNLRNLDLSGNGISAKVLKDVIINMFSVHALTISYNNVKTPEDSAVLLSAFQAIQIQQFTSISFDGLTIDLKLLGSTFSRRGGTDMKLSMSKCTFPSPGQSFPADDLDDVTTTKEAKTWAVAVALAKRVEKVGKPKSPFPYLKNLSSVIELRMRDTNLSAADISIVLENLKYLPKLKELDIKGNTLPVRGRLKDALKSLPSLRCFASDIPSCDLRPFLVRFPHIQFKDRCGPVTWTDPG